MSIRDRIFPPGPARDGHIVRTAAVETWESQLIGLGRLTAFVSPRLLAQSHAVDDAALAVVFLQRHRVEVGLKLILERARARIPAIHRLTELRGLCEQACTRAGLGAEWPRYMAPHIEFIDLMDVVDPDAATYRYPVDRSFRPWPREPFVDLLELEAAGSAFQSGIQALVAFFAAREPLPVGASDAQATASELAALIGACRDIAGLQAETKDLLRAERKKIEALGGKSRRPTSPSAQPDALAAAAAVTEVTLSLADRAEQLLTRIVTQAAIPHPVIPPPVPVSPFPTFAGVPPARWGDQQAAQIRWFAKTFSDRARPLLIAVRAAEARSEDWSGAAAR